MEGSDIARLTYLVLLGVAVGGWLVLEHRRPVGTMLRQAGVWAFIFLGAIAGAAFLQDIRSEIAVPQQLSFVGDTARVETERAFDGHFYMTLSLNDVPVQFVVDTGASDLVLTRGDAERLGVDVDGLSFDGVAGTANGQVRTARMWVDEIALGPVVDRRVPVLINSGEMDKSLLGMSYLERFSRIEIAGNTLTLER